MEFHGVPKTEGENLLSKVNELARVLDVPELTIHEVAAVHRLPSRPEKIPGIVVRFTSQATRDVWLDKKAKLRTTGTNIYINENLTKFNRELLVKMKEWARQKGFSYVWHRNGKLFALSYLHVTDFIERLGHETKTSIRAVHLNVRSAKNKIIDLECLFSQFEIPFNAILLTETWCTSENDAFQLPSYERDCLNRTSSRGGGVCALIEKKNEM